MKNWMVVILLVKMSIGFAQSSVNTKIIEDSICPYVDYGKILDKYVELIQKEPEEPKWHFEKGKVLVCQSNFLEAEKCFLKTLSLSNDSILLSKCNLMLGEIYFVLSKDKRALKSFSLAIKHNPNNFQAYLQRGAVNWEKHKLNLAIQDIYKGINIDTNYYLGYFYLANIYCETQEYDTSFYYINKAYSKGYTPNDLIFLRARINFELGNYNSSIEDLIFLKDTPYRNSAMYNYVFASNYMELKKWDDALPYIKNLESEVYEPWMISQIGLYYYEIGEYKKAIQFYTKRLEFDKTNFYANLFLGITYAKIGNLEKSERFLKKTQKLEEENYLLYYGFGELYSRSGDIGKAIQSYTESIELMSRNDYQDFEPYLGRGATYLKLGKHELACIDLQQAIEINTETEIDAIIKGLLNCDKY